VKSYCNIELELPHYQVLKKQYHGAQVLLQEGHQAGTKLMTESPYMSQQHNVYKDAEV
jgi:hypothetical protein